MNLSSLINTARTPMTLDEKGSIRRSARMGVYVVARVIGFVSWVLVSLWIMLWGALKVIPNMGRLVQDGLGVTSANAPSTEAFIAYWVAPMLLITIVISAGVIWLCALGHRGMNKMFAAMRRWVDRAEFDTSDKALDKMSEKLSEPVKRAKKAEKKSRQR
jgi:hypothetical protein